MNIVILTSHNHWYANALLVGLFRLGVFKGDRITVWEQDAIVPGKTHTAGLWKYLVVAGGAYVFWQAVKQCTFIYKRFIAQLLHNTRSSCYPYYVLRPVGRETVNGIKRSYVTARLKRLRPDLMLSLFSKEIIPPEILQIPKYGSVNLHPAPLPRYKGVSPTFWAMAEGKTMHGVTLHVLDAGIDTGRIISKKMFSLRSYMTEHEVYMRCVKEGISLVASYIQMVKRRQVSSQGVAMKGKGCYRSLPTRLAVWTFFRRGKRFI